MKPLASHHIDRALERESIERFQHPGNLIDAQAPTFKSADPKPDGVEAFKQLFLFCMPEIKGTHYPMLTCFRRMCITVYITSPEIFVGSSFEELADTIGITRASAYNEATLIRAQLAQRARGTAPRIKRPRLTAKCFRLPAVYTESQSIQDQHALN